MTHLKNYVKIAKMLRNLYIEITNICNLNCPFCPDTKREKKFMSAEGFAYIIGKVKNSAGFFYLHVLGEPLLNPDFKQILNIADENNIKVKLTTNGTLLKNNLENIINSKCISAVNISLTACVNFQNENNKKTGYINPAIENAVILSQNSKPVTLRYWRKHSGDGDFDLIRDLINNKFNIYLNPNTAKTVLARNLIFDLDAEFVWPVKTTDSGIVSDSRCLGLIKQAAILCGGEVVPCCLDSEGKMALGNIFEDSLENILLSEKAKKIREGFLNNKAYMPFCKTCLFKCAKR